MWCFFFFKQKTAYEMRISDWSSDVCSSDLDRLTHSSTDRAYWRVRFGAEIRSRRARLAGESVRHRLDVCLPRLSPRQGVDQGLRFGKQFRFRQVQIERLAARLGRVEIGRAHVCTPVTNAHLLCRLLLQP